MASRTACLASESLFVPAHGPGPVEDEAEVDGRPAARRVRRRRSGAVISTSRNRSLRPLARMRRRSGRTTRRGSTRRSGLMVVGHDGPPSRWLVEARMGRVSGLAWPRRAAHRVRCGWSAMVAGWWPGRRLRTAAVRPRTAPARSAPAGPRACWLRRSRGRRTWSSMSGVMTRRSHVERSGADARRSGPRRSRRRRRSRGRRRGAGCQPGATGAARAPRRAARHRRREPRRRRTPPARHHGRRVAGRRHGEPGGSRRPAPRRWAGRRTGP